MATEHSPNQTDAHWLEQSYEKLLKKMAAENARTGSNIPFIPRAGQYFDLGMPDGIYWWTNGFWPGILWQIYNATGDAAYKTSATGVEDRLAEALTGFEGLHHDIGFLFLPSAVAHYRQTGSQTARTRALHAANLLAGRFNPAGGFIRAWNDDTRRDDVPNTGWMIIDCLLNIPLLYWASEETGDPRFAHIANTHANTAAAHILRPDGSANHIASFDAATGEFLSAPGGQGYGEGSSWSRGQGWALYGFTIAHAHTGNDRYLACAKQSAHYCIANLAVSGWLPLVDFRAPKEPVLYDSGAGAIIAAGLLALARQVPPLERPLYTEAAVHILKALDKKFSDWSPETDGLITGGTTQYHDSRLANLPIIYNDYFFIEALLTLKGKSMQIW